MRPLLRSLGANAAANSHCTLLSLRGGVSDMSAQAYEWTVNIGTPATQ